MFMQRRSQLDKSEKWGYFVSWAVPPFSRGTARGLLIDPVLLQEKLNYLYLLNLDSSISSKLLLLEVDLVLGVQ